MTPRTVRRLPGAGPSSVFPSPAARRGSAVVPARGALLAGVGLLRARERAGGERVAGRPGAPQRPAAGAQERAILGRPRLPLLSAPTASHSGYLRAAGRGRVWSEEVPRTAGHSTGGFPAGAGGRSRAGRSGQGQVHPRRVARAAESHHLPRPACTGDGTDSGGFEFLESG